MLPSSGVPLISLFASLPRLARFSTLRDRLQAAAEAFLAEGWSGVQLLMFGRRALSLTVKHGELSFVFEPEFTSRARRALFEAIVPFGRDGIYQIDSAMLQCLDGFGLRQETRSEDLVVVPLSIDEREIGLLILHARHKLEPEEAASLRMWSDIFSAMIMNDVRVALYEELELIMRTLRQEHDVMGVLETVAEALAHEYGGTCEAWQYERGQWSLVAVSPYAGKIVDLDLSPLLSGDEGVISLGTAVGAPLMVDAQLWGALAIDEQSLDGERRNFLRMVARHSELALENALAIERHRRFARESTALSNAGRMLFEATRLEPLAAVISRIAAELGEARYAALYREDDERHFVRVNAFPSSAAEPVNIQLSDFTNAIRNTAPIIARSGYLAFVPLGERILRSERAQHQACLVLGRSLDDKPFTADAIRLLEAFATLGTLALRNARLYEEANEANNALGESNAFKDDLLAMFTHDFKGPLTVISGYGELVLDKLQGEERDSVGIILAQVKRLALLADDALALARTQARGFALERVPSELISFVRDVAHTSFGTAGARLQMEERLHELRLCFDPHALRHVLENIIGNALKYSEHEVRIEVLRERDEAAIIIRDRGIGIPAEEITNIFGRFARASNARRRGISGSGVGLYVANRLVEEHGGMIFVSSCEGAGSTFEVRLPMTLPETR